MTNTTTLVANSGQTYIRASKEGFDATAAEPAFIFPIAECWHVEFEEGDDYLDIALSCLNEDQSERVISTIAHLEGCDSPYGLILQDHGLTGQTCIWAVLWEGHENLDELREGHDRASLIAAATEQVLANIPS